jgi:hypothetical protein
MKDLWRNDLDIIRRITHSARPPGYASNRGLIGSLQLLLEGGSDASRGMRTARLGLVRRSVVIGVGDGMMAMLITASKKQMQLLRLFLVDASY